MNNPHVPPVALVTGASRGIGRAIALKLASDGVLVLAAGRDQTATNDTVSAITSSGGQAEAVTLDVTNETSVVQVFSTIRERFGKLDILVNNAGLGRYAAIRDIDLGDVDAIHAVNVRGVLACCREALPLMEGGHDAYIINIGSVVSLKGYPNQAAYTASKHALLGITKSLAAEVQGSAIRVSAVLPGGVATDMVAQARPDLDLSILLDPNDVADAVHYLTHLGPNAAIDTIYLRRRTSSPF